MSTKTWEDSVEEIWKLFREADKRSQKADARLDKYIEEADKRSEEASKRSEEASKRSEEASKRSEEMDERLDKRIRETDARLDKLFKKTNKEINKLSGIFSSQWGKMIEAIVEPNAIKLFQERGIKVQYVSRRMEVKVDGRTMELDIILDNGSEVVIIEVKSTLKVDDVRDFLDTLDKFLYFFPRYKSYKIYGGVAGMIIEEGADRYAYKQGLFVLSAAGDGIAQIKNDLKFVPTDFGSKKKPNISI